MKKVFLMSALATIVAMNVSAQTTSDSTILQKTKAIPTDKTVKKAKRDWSKLDLSNRTSDHFLIQIGHDNWAGKPDSIRTKGLSRSFNMYFMLDKPFKGNPHFSLAFGAGIGSSNIFFEKTVIDITGKKNLNKMTFQNADSTDHYKKYKLVNVWAEIPLELRWVSNPENVNKSWKVAAGLKFGTMLDAHTKGKELQDKNDNTLSGQGKVVIKEKSKRFFNSTRIAGTIRIGYGHFSLYGAYQINSLIKEGYGPQVKPYTIGIAISGL